MTTLDPKTVARQVTATLQHDPADIRDFVFGEDPDMSGDQEDALVKEVVQLLQSATITVTFPGEQSATEQARLLRAFADKIDRGADVPMPPSVYSALARETADALDGRLAESEGE